MNVLECDAVPKRDDDRFDDPHAPPAEPCAVCCLHCGASYGSDEIVWRPVHGAPFDGAWCCPTPGCIAVGFGFDILPAEFVEDDDDDDAGELPIDVFDDDPFWVDLAALMPRRTPIGNTPRPPFDVGAPQHLSTDLYDDEADEP